MGDDGEAAKFLRRQAATAEAPLAWLRMEPGVENVADMEIRLRLWPGGEDRLLGTSHRHAAWVKWGD